MNKINFHPSSFRDPSGSIIIKDGKLYRTINNSYRQNYDFLISSGLYSELLRQKLIIPHTEIKEANTGFPETVYKIIKPEFIPFISYPYEWSFQMLMDAALLILKIQKIAIKFGMSLKDASAYNIQFQGTTPVLIDTLSFEIHDNSLPWIAYSQFCRHFLGPLALAGYKNLDLLKLLQIYIDGIPLNLSVSLLPYSAFLNIHLLIHLFLHNLGAKKMESAEIMAKPKLNAGYSQDLIISLRRAIDGCKIKSGKTKWSEYYVDNNYNKASFASKIEIVTNLFKQLRPGMVADLGANTGTFSRIASPYSGLVISCDNDPQAINENFLILKNEKITNVLPLNIDLFNPSPGTGWINKERISFLERLKVDCVLALALIHHLYFSNNLDFQKIASFFNSIAEVLVIEFIEPEDSQIKSLIGMRQDDFSAYNESNFRKQFSRYYKFTKEYRIKNSKRTVFLLKRI